LLPDQPPEAVQELALLEDQIKVDAPPLTMPAGLALSVTVAAGVTGPEGDEVGGGVEFPPPQAASAAMAEQTPAQCIGRSPAPVPALEKGVQVAIATLDARLLSQTCQTVSV
jgi:hypothetical protein